MIDNIDLENNLARQLIKKLSKVGKTISVMESCTGGQIASVITNSEGASNVFEFGAVTYSNEYKIKLGVDPLIIEKYTVYSIETAKEMSLKISKFTGSDYGIGVTGKLNREDSSNPFGENNKVYLSVYDKGNKKFFTKEVYTHFNSRLKNKLYLTKIALDMVCDIL